MSDSEYEALKAEDKRLYAEYSKADEIKSEIGARWNIVARKLEYETLARKVRAEIEAEKAATQPLLEAQNP